MQDLMQVNRPSIPSQACVSALARGDLEANSAPLPGYKCQACSSRSLKCLGSLDALNALHKASTSSTHNLENSLCQAADLNNQMKQIRSLFDTTRELFLQSILDLQNAGEDPVVVLEALKAAEPNRQAISLNEWTLLATLFQWPSPFNLSGLDFDNRTPGESTVHINNGGHLVESSPPLDSAVEVLEGLNEVEKGSADEATSSVMKSHDAPFAISDRAHRVTVPKVTECLSAEDEWDSSEVINNTAVTPLVPGDQEYKREELSSSQVGAAVSPVTRSEPKNV
ncbi:hypothetical protein EV359DRAFT_86820 [Lentinula novae-zelandiae]|nr:hypothetical protein EV359DRAFT_86820 [Lentinula novae-zelandiae]